MSCYKGSVNKLSVLPCTLYTVKTCCKSLDRPLKSEDECECCNYRGEDTCSGCILVFAPCAFISDLITLPFRSVIRCFGISCKKKIVPVYIEHTFMQFDEK